MIFRQFPKNYTTQSGITQYDCIWHIQIIVLLSQAVSNTIIFLFSHLKNSSLFITSAWVNIMIY